MQAVGEVQRDILGSSEDQGAAENCTVESLLRTIQMEWGFYPELDKWSLLLYPSKKYGCIFQCLTVCERAG